MAIHHTKRAAIVTKLRKMLSVGIPETAVAQRGELEGIDMAMILSQTASPLEDDSAVEKSSPSIPPRFLEKYQRMLRNRIPLKGVQCQAFVDGQWTPEELLEALDEDVLAEIRGIPEFYQPRPAELAVAGRKRSRPVEICTAAVFEVQENGNIISLPSESPLAALLRRLIPGLATKREEKLTVETLTLYHAMGALKGVQIARNDYNSAVQSSASVAERKLKSQAFAEMARAIQLHLPPPTNEFQPDINISGLDMLVTHIQKVYKSEIEEIRAMVDEGWYDFESLASLFEPGSRVVAKNVGGGGVDMICRVAWNKYEQGRTLGGVARNFQMCLQYMVAVGPGRVACAEVVERMEAFDGRRRIFSDLTFVPLTSYTQEQQLNIRKQFCSRGVLYNRVVLNGTHAYMAYDKGSFFIKRTGGPLSSSMNSSASSLATGGRIMLDIQSGYDHGHSLGVGYEPMVMGIKYKYKEYQLSTRATSSKKQPYNSALGNDDQSFIVLDQLPEEFLDMVWPLAIGFSLTARGWGDVLVDGLGDIQWQHDIFDRLVLSETRKCMIKALVRNGGNDSFHDLVEGKGEGTVFLLYGKAGVGKTLTAEAVAEYLHKPLYSLSLGTLGTTAAVLEKCLSEIMSLTANWDALLLLDEADSFLETRSSTSSLERNAMVSVMLRLVEYFSGILFLTSNRLESLDPAFQTRITLALRYDALDASAREKVWKNLLVKSGLDYLLDDGTLELDKLSIAPLNGREIKNVLRLAMAISTEKKESLSQNTLLDMVNVVTEFKSSNGDPYGLSDDSKDDSDNQLGCFSWMRLLKQ